MKRVAHRIGLVFVIGLVLAATASAYTVVMHGGRRVEIPAHFIVTASTLTYEVSPGIQITLAMAAIDIPATEKVNNELPGGLLRRARSGGTQEAVEDKRAVRAVQTRTITNRDLESSMRRRRDSELAYESRRRQLGLPSVAESRKQAATEAELIGIELEQKRAAEKESEDYWRGRAGTLRTEMVALDSELAYIRARLDEGPLLSSNGWSSVSFNTVTPGLPFPDFGRRSFGTLGGGAGFPVHPQHRPSIFVAPRAGAQATGRFSFGGAATRAQVLVSPGTFRHTRPVGVGGGFSTFPSVVFGSSLPAYDYSYERGALVTRFNELAAARAGLNARWRELEDEARRAGAPPGWLRP